MAKHRLGEGLEPVGRVLSDAEVDDTDFGPGVTVLTAESIEARRLHLARTLMNDTVELPQVQS